MNRRTFLKVAAVSFAGFLAGCGVEDKKNLPIKFLRQIITKNISETRCIMWQSDKILKNPAAEVKFGDFTKIFPAIDSSFSDDGKKIIQYTAQIEIGNEFRIIDGERATGWQKLTIPDEKNFKAIIFPDSQCGGSYETWGKVAKNAFERNSDANFFVNVGDIVDNGEDNAQWEDWLTQIQDFMPKMSFAPIMGNHETYSRDWKVRQPISYLNYFSTPNNGESEVFQRRFYSFDCGAAHFAILDSQWDELGREIIDIQKKWLENDLKSTDKQWKVIFIHKDVLQYKINRRPERQEGFSEIGEIFMPEFEKLGIDAVFTAHLHTYRNRGRLKNFQADDNGILYILTGLSGNVRYSELWIDHKLDKFVAPQPEIDNYLTLEGNDKILAVKCFLPNGELIDETTLQKT